MRTLTILLFMSMLLFTGCSIEEGMRWALLYPLEKFNQEVKYLAQTCPSCFVNESVNKSITERANGDVKE